GVLENNPLRALEPDLDAFPFPFRSEIKKYVLEKKYSTLIAGRGCIYNCAFCDIREFYGQSPGPVKRIRKPDRVVEEMEYLHKEHDCSVFLFQDDDFPVKTNRTSEWVQEFCKSLRDKNLIGKILWKINCRPDEVDLELFELMKEHGLFKVYLGIEDGTDAGLLQMNKRLKVSDHNEGILILKELGIIIDYGFMLFQPSSTYDSLNENLTFLEQICSDGYMPVSFLKMMPYLATRIEKELRAEGRLKGRPGFLDYDFIDRSIDHFYAFESECFNTWLYSAKGLRNYSKWGINYLSAFTFFHGSSPEIEGLYESLTNQVADSNRFIIKTLKELSALFESGEYTMENDRILDDYRSSIEQKHSSALKITSGIIEEIEVQYLTKDLFV
ncbi:MAG: radical SAM protein, partial [Bacteroidales bacterium]|nr:radical SAM protein [Bacteroidales bacterium]